LTLAVAGSVSNRPRWVRSAPLYCRKPCKREGSETNEGDSSRLSSSLKLVSHSHLSSYECERSIVAVYDSVCTLLTHHLLSQLGSSPFRPLTSALPLLPSLPSSTASKSISTISTLSAHRVEQQDLPGTGASPSLLLRLTASTPPSPSSGRDEGLAGGSGGYRRRSDSRWSSGRGGEAVSGRGRLTSAKGRGRGQHGCLSMV
jgi:hypothetical protein